MTTILLLLVIFQVKHFVCDYPLQTEYMLGKFKPYIWQWVGPLTCHALVHAAATFIISIHFVGVLHAFCLATLDGLIHFSMDRVKASPYMLGKYKPLTKEQFAAATKREKLDNKLFWWSLGLDQMVHHLTHYLIIYCLLQ